MRTALSVIMFVFAAAAACARQTALLGAWRCQTPQGAVTLSFDNANQLVYNGDATQCLVQGSVITALMNGIPTQYRYQVSRNALVIANPDGSRANCQRARAAGLGGGGVG